ncbi:hypothetical protein [Actinacidiphila bryophytorum]|uniref:Uncharacterized protein n=1 Tax=Actinacidiphila bryophytorum TaxID=1436133 RepID=A0A9W4H3W2_9ACTN|nr:hypothetical protein [Actinacidiphila bryophytorum]MBM9439893.1 hypothetical protein [Actinacidiphila bryophytorum]MBN6547335.1 hypothetical protein [Actinacidiphila bryophytorum]CAG7648427.1 conserved hypothetical protein [Actinacidiphila bryophytorum]
MDVVPLETAYLFLLAAAEDVSTARDGEDTTDWSAADRAIACVRLNDGVLATAAAELGKGRPVRFDNRPAMGGPAGTGVPTPEAFRENLRLVRESTRRLVALVAAMPDDAATTSLRVTLVAHDGESLVDQQITWGRLVHLWVTDHLPPCTARRTAARHP